MDALSEDPKKNCDNELPGTMHTTFPKRHYWLPSCHKSTPFNQLCNLIINQNVYLGVTSGNPYEIWHFRRHFGGKLVGVWV
jgi:hypothetical protein